jgi:hypothetical protein
MKHRFAEEALAEFIATGRHYNQQVPGLGGLSANAKHRTQRWLCRINPNGIEAFSPGLRGTSYPGDSGENHNPERVESIFVRSCDATLSGLFEFIALPQGSRS